MDRRILALLGCAALLAVAASGRATCIEGCFCAPGCFGEWDAGRQEYLGYMSPSTLCRDQFHHTGIPNQVAVSCLEPIEVRRASKTPVCPGNSSTSRIEAKNCHHPWGPPLERITCACIPSSH